MPLNLIDALHEVINETTIEQLEDLLTLYSMELSARQRRLLECIIGDMEEIGLLMPALA